MRHSSNYEMELDAEDIYTNANNEWRVIPEKNTVVQRLSNGPVRNGKNSFKCNKVFDGDATNRDVYNSVCQKTVDSFLGGINGMIVAYGQAGSGKTYTMQGCSDDPKTYRKGQDGIVHMTASNIFQHIQSVPQKKYSLYFSAYEIYMQEVKDLLRLDIIQCRQDPKTRLLLDLSEQIVSDYDELIGLINLCNQRRNTRKIDVNNRSSRSHVVYSITLQCLQSSNQSVVSTLYLVKLAGTDTSLRKHKQVRGKQQDEANHINKR
jgi:hypothetical protein